LVRGGEIDQACKTVSRLPLGKWHGWPSVAIQYLVSRVFFSRSGQSVFPQILQMADNSIFTGYM
jgi:hypothetical protein